MVLDSKILEELTKEQASLEPQSSREFVRRLEQQLLRAYEQKDLIIPWKERMKLFVFTNIFFMKKFVQYSLGSGILIILLFSCLVVFQRPLVVQAFNVVKDTVEKILNIQTISTRQDGTISFSTESACDDSGCDPSRITSSSFYSVHDLVAIGKAEIILEETILGEKVMAMHLLGDENDDSYKLFVGNYIRGTYGKDIRKKFSNLQVYFSEQATKMIKDYQEKEMSKNHLKNTYQTDRFSSLQDLLKETQAKVIYIITAQHNETDGIKILGEQFVVVRFPDGSTAKVQEYTLVTPEGSFEKFYVDPINLEKEKWPWVQVGTSTSN